jgi:hypothetical protein
MGDTIVLYLGFCSFIHYLDELPKNYGHIAQMCRAKLNFFGQHFRHGQNLLRWNALHNCTLLAALGLSYWLPNNRSWCQPLFHTPLLASSCIILYLDCFLTNLYTRDLRVIYHLLLLWTASPIPWNSAGTSYYSCARHCAVTPRLQKWVVRPGPDVWWLLASNQHADHSFEPFRPWAIHT